MSKQHRSPGRASRALRQETAVANTDQRQARSPQEQLDLLDQRLGEEIGAVRERMRLESQIRRLAEEKGKREEIGRRRGERGTEREKKGDRVKERSKDRRKNERGRSRAGRREGRREDR